jgi:hemoglobin
MGAVGPTRSIPSRTGEISLVDLPTAPAVARISPRGTVDLPAKSGRTKCMTRRRALVLSLAAGLAVGGCAGPAPLYDRLGGLTTMEHLGDSLVIDIGRDPMLVRRFKGFSITDVQRQRTANIAFACTLAGGPCRYGGRPVDEIHRGMDIDDEEFDRMIRLFAAALYRASPDRLAADELVARFEALRPKIVASPSPPVVGASRTF